MNTGPTLFIYNKIIEKIEWRREVPIYWNIYREGTEVVFSVEIVCGKDN